MQTLALAAALAAAVTAAVALAPRAAIETAVTIAAPPAVVWAVLTDGAAYPEWNPFIRSMAGDIAPGARLTTVMHPAGGSPMTFRPVVLVAEPERALRWLGRLGLPRLFDGEHWFRLEPAPGGTRLIHGENFRGLLLWVMATDGFAKDFGAMNAALKARAEARAAP